MISARTQDQIEAYLHTLQPPSDGDFVFHGHGYEGALDRMLGYALAGVETQAVGMQFEIDPRTAVYTLDAFLRCLGPDGWGLNELGMTAQQQAEIAYLRWAAGGNVCAGLFVEIAAALGVAISITEHVNTVCGAPNAVAGGCCCQPSPAQFVWTITLPAAAISTSYSGAANCGAAWAGGGFTPNLIQGVITELAPEHTLPLFSYQG